MKHPKILAFVLAGGKGTRLAPLTEYRSKPSVPFGGRYRIVDFVLSNLVNSRVYSIYLLVQYKSQSLIEHVRQNWVLSPIVRDHFVAVVPPQMRMGPEWFQGTADAVYQNINLLLTSRAELVLVFGADHIYRMDIRQMVDFHLESGADVTVAARPVPLDQASSFGVIRTDREQRITGFEEKPERPTPMPTDPARAYVSMGNYLFNREVLLESLVAAQERGQNDFGTHIIPDLVKSERIFAYDFGSNTIRGIRDYEEPGYWRDVGTIPAYFAANMDMLGKHPRFELNNGLWPIHPAEYEGPAAKVLKGEIVNSVLSEGVLVEDARIANSVIRRDVSIGRDVVIEDSIIMDHVAVGNGCRIRRAIVDKLNVLAPGTRIGVDRGEDLRLPRVHLDPEGITIVARHDPLTDRI